jgi:hypothetical protein
MATSAQILANQANAQHSTGPKTDEGKAKASRNNIRHGLCLGILVLSTEEQAYQRDFEAKMRLEIKPAGAIEETVFAQLVDAHMRLRKIQHWIGTLMFQHADDPLVVDAAAAEVNQLTRYRAAAEMQFYTTVNTLMELQTTRLHRDLHLVKSEEEYIPPMVKGSAKMWFDNARRNHNDREIFYAIYPVLDPLCGRLPKLPSRPPGYESEFANADPIAA